MTKGTQEKEGTPIRRIRQSVLVTRIQALWSSGYVEHRELWWAAGLILLGIFGWMAFPYLPFVMPETFGVPVMEVAVPGAQEITVVHPNRVVMGQSFRLSVVYDQTSPLPEEVEELEIRIVPTPSAVRVDPAQIVFPASERLPSHLSKDITLLIPIIDPLPDQAALQLTIIVGSSTYDANVDLPLVTMPRLLLHLLLALGGLLSLQSLCILVTTLFKFFRSRIFPQDSKNQPGA